MNNVTNKIVMLHWCGRFGNRMFQYAFICSYAHKYGCVAYMPSEWEGNVIFDKGPCLIIPDDTLRLHINQKYATEQYRKQHFNEYVARTGDRVQLVTMGHAASIGRTNIAFDDLDCMYYTHCFQVYDDIVIRKIFRFNERVTQSAMYRYHEARRNTYDVAHLRRGDIAAAKYQGHHSMISKRSYDAQIQALGISTVHWVSDDTSVRTSNPWSAWSVAGHQWSFPCGEKEVPGIFFDFLPDFLTILFARTILRANSSFSWWASHLSQAELVMSPVLSEKPKSLEYRFYEMDAKFIIGNAPHFMGSKKEGAYHDIILPLKK